MHKSSPIQSHKTKHYLQRRQTYIQSKLRQLRQSYHHNQSTSIPTSTPPYKQQSSSIDRSGDGKCQKMCGKRMGMGKVEESGETGDSQSTGVSVGEGRFGDGVDGIRRYVFGVLWECSGELVDANNKNPVTIDCFQIYQQLYKLKAQYTYTSHQDSKLPNFLQQLTQNLLKLHHHSSQLSQPQPSQSQSQPQPQPQPQHKSFPTPSIYSCLRVYLCVILVYIDDVVRCKGMGLFYRVGYLVDRVVEFGEDGVVDLGYYVLLRLYRVMGCDDSECNDYDQSNPQTPYKKTHPNHLSSLLQSLPTIIQKYPQHLPYLSLSLFPTQPIQSSCQYQLLQHLLSNIDIGILMEYVNMGGLEILVEVERRFVGICVKRLEEFVGKGDKGEGGVLLEVVMERYGWVLNEEMYLDQQLYEDQDQLFYQYQKQQQ